MVMSNNSADQIVSSGLISSIGVPFHRSPGFTIPLVRLTAGGNSYYIQRIDRNKKIAGFDLFDAAVNLRRLTRPYQLEIGNNEVYSLVDPSGIPHVGTKRELAPIIRNWVSEVEHPLLRMNFARFCGQEGLASRAANEAVRLKKNEFNDEEAAIHWFIDSVVSAELVAMLISANSESITEDAMNKNHLTVSNLSESRLLLQIVTRNSSKLSFDNRVVKELEKLKIFIGKVLGRSVHIDVVDAEQPSGDDWGGEISARGGDRDERRTERIVNEIRHRRRQEERLALVLDLLLANDSAGWDILRSYDDRAKFARVAIVLLADELSKKQISRGNKNLSKVISQEIWTMFRLAYPTQRGILLLEFAKVLKRHADIANTIKSVCRTSDSMYVNGLRQKILDELHTT